MRIFTKKNLTLIFTASVLIASAVVVWKYFADLSYYFSCFGSGDLYDSPEDFGGFDNDLGAPSCKYIVPNIVHFIRWNKTFSFIEAVCLMAAVKNQKPEKIYIHGDGNVEGKYWDMAMSYPGVKSVLELKHLEVPKEIFGQKLKTKYHHQSDVERIRVLMRYGGIYLDNDSFLVRNLDEFRKFEMTLGWEEGKELMANQGIVAHKNARFLRKWLESYRDHYNGEWYYNTGVRPVQTILKTEPFLIHRMTHLWGEDPIGHFLYLENDPTWRNHYVIHLSVKTWAERGKVKGNLSSSATYPVQFDENNIKKYNCTVRDMVQSVYPLHS